MSVKSVMTTRLALFGEWYFKLDQAYTEILAKLTDKQLDELFEAVNWPTEANCSFDVYYAAQILKRKIGGEFARRRARA